MGSARVSNAKPIPMDKDKKSFITLFTVNFKSIFNKKKVRPKKEIVEEKKEIKNDVNPTQNTNTVDAVLENFNKLNLEDSKNIKETKVENEDDELNNFAIKVIDEPRVERIHSQTSEDSGFLDTKDAEGAEKTENGEKLLENAEKSGETAGDNDETDDLVEDLEKLELDVKKKKMQMIVLKRSPMRTKLSNYTPSVCPYPTQEQESYRQISQINKHTLSGGQVLVNQCQLPDNLSEIDIALESVQKQSQYLQNDGETYLEDVMELISEDTHKQSMLQTSFTSEYDFPDQINPNTDYVTDKKAIQNSYLVDYVEKTVQHNDLMQLLQGSYDITPESPNPINEFRHEEFTEILNCVQKEFTNTSNDSFVGAKYTYPTPPRSETVPSPMTASPSSFYPSTSEYTLSPGRSPVYNSDYEKYQEIPHFEEEKESIDKKARERTASISSMTMKQFKDMQKEIVCNFSKRDCCQMSRKSCKDIFKEHHQKVKMAVRKNICMEVAKLDLKKAPGVLQNILINLSSSSDKEDAQYTLFCLLCERMLAQHPAIFVGDAGLRLLKSAALRCPHRPLLTRYLVQCIRTAIKADPNLVSGREHIFHEVDVLGDNLVIACARAGDRCSDVLSELLGPHESQPPLFRNHLTNSDGYTALHVACSQHSASNPRLHTVHVLIVHGGFDITEGDVKGGDTALHLAVNSAHCDLQLILMMFKQVDRKDWKSLAHCPNLSSKTPIDLARLATKTTTRQNYPQEVLDFLKKCR